MNTANDTLEMLGTLTYLLWNNAERGDSDPETVANAAHLMYDLIATARKQIGGEVA